MKKIIIIIVVLAVLVGGYVWLSRFRMNIEIFTGQTMKAFRGDLVVPITASGNIKPASITQVKGKASGEVVKIPFKPGQMVRNGSLLIELLDVDERRSMEQAQATFNRAQIALDQARITLKQREGAGRVMAAAKVAQAKGQGIVAKARYDKYLPLTRPADGGPPLSMAPGEWDQVVGAYEEAEAAIAAAEAEQMQAEVAVEMAAQEVKNAQENLRSTDAALKDADQRLIETKILAPIDGMILTCNVQKGEVVQGGKTMFTGGTVLLEIADVSEIYAVVNVDEADIGLVRELAPPSARPGPTATQPTTQMATLPAGTIEEKQPVEVTVESFRDEKFGGIIERIAPQSEFAQAIATFKVWIRLTSPNRDKLIGLLNTQAEARFTARSVRDAVLVSYDAIQKNPTGDDQGVFVPVPGPDRYKFKPCKFGADNGIDVEVVEGLKVGEVVYTKLPQMSRKQQEEKDKRSE